MDKHELEQYARAMPIGSKKRVPCCGADNSCVVWREREGASCKCFRCGESWRVSFAPSLAELRERESAISSYLSKQTSSLTTPKDLSWNLPAHALVYTATRGMTPRMLTPWCGWSESLYRLVMTFYWDGCLEAVLLKDTATARPKPKYLARYANGAFCYPLFLHGTHYMGSGIPKVNSLCIAEDAFSAARISDAGWPCLALIGTHTSVEAVSRVLALSPNAVTIWLDGDAAGHSGRRKLKRQLELVGKTVHTVQTPRDPKYYTNEQVQEYLCAASQDS